MPRPNRARSIDGEANLAQRIRYEREGEGWSPADLARRMTEAGCSITTSAIYKIEARERTIKVDELIGLSRVFDLPVENLLTPMEVLRKEWAELRVRDLDEAEGGLYDAISRLGDVWMDVYSHGLLDVVDDVEEEDSVLAYLANRRRVDNATGESRPVMEQVFSLVAETIQKSAAELVVRQANEKLGAGAIEIEEGES